MHEAESEKLARSWMRHDAAWLRDYLVGGVEDPRLNVQSILSRHFLIRALTGERFSAFMDQEIRFAAAMNWLAELVTRDADRDDFAAILHSLRRGADNIEGSEIPRFMVPAFAALPINVGGLLVPNYIESFLTAAESPDDPTPTRQASLDTFCRLWNEALGQTPPGDRRLSVLEPACGSANDYRCLHACGIARLIDYTGFDLCSKNVENARALFPGVRFEVGNAFAIAAPDKSFDLCFVHDLFEHLSLEGMETAVKEVCRVTRRGLCVGFFQMAEMASHVLRVVDEYHLNTLSMARMRELFAAQGFVGQAIHIATFLRDQAGCRDTHNPNAYTFVLARER
jgi:ubiquinone/menaquinone biosynthesis C-methylase UbiE